MGSGRIVIVGGGMAGVSTAWWLARAGRREVVLLEREQGLGWHSSGLNAAILRTAIAAGPTRRLAEESARFLRQPPAGFATDPLLDPIGLVVLEGEEGAPPSPWVEPLLASGDLEALDDRRLRRIAPHFVPLGRRAWHLRGEGRIDIAALLQGFERGARRGGVEIRTGARAAGLLLSGGSVVGVQLADGTAIEAEHTVLAAGGWARDLGRMAGSRAAMRPMRRHLLVTAPDPRVDGSWPVVWDDRAGFYVRPESGGLLLSACDEEEVDPDGCAGDPAVQLVVAAKTAERLPGFEDAPVAHFWAGVRTLTDDDCPVIGPDPVAAGLFWVAGLGGHGMSVASAIGRLASELLTGEAADPDLARAVSPARFGAGCAAGT